EFDARKNPRPWFGGSEPLPASWSIRPAMRCCGPPRPLFGGSAVGSWSVVPDWRARGKPRPRLGGSAVAPESPSVAACASLGAPPTPPGGTPPGRAVGTRRAAALASLARRRRRTRGPPSPPARLTAAWRYLPLRRGTLRPLFGGSALGSWSVTPVCALRSGP